MIEPRQTHLNFEIKIRHYRNPPEADIMIIA